LFWVFQGGRHYGRTLRDLHGPHAIPAWPGWRAERPEKSIGVIDIVSGHNDVLATNLPRDGRRLWLVHWEYAVFNSPLFALRRAKFPREAAEHMAELYFEHPVITSSSAYGGDDRISGLLNRAAGGVARALLPMLIGEGYRVALIDVNATASAR